MANYVAQVGMTVTWPEGMLREFTDAELREIGKAMLDVGFYVQDAIRFRKAGGRPKDG